MASNNKQKKIQQKPSAEQNKIPPTGAPKYKKGDICRAKVYFEDEPKKYKTRPFLVMRNEKNGKVLGCMITGTKARNEDDHDLQDWKESNLDKRSTARINRFITVPITDIDRPIGKASKRDMEAICNKRLSKRLEANERQNSDAIPEKIKYKPKYRNNKQKLDTLQQAQRDIPVDAPNAYEHNVNHEYKP